MDSTFVVMDLTRMPSHRDEPATIRCGRCFDELDRHQLDIERPSRLLGTCDSCKAWYLIELEEGVMVLLPDASDLRGQ